MLFVLSPAKSLDYETPAPTARATRPHFLDRSAELIDVLRTKSAGEIAELMDLSPALAALNAARYAAWSPRFTPRNSRPAIHAFDGDVYQGLDAATLTEDEIAWANDHLAILSGLHGVLRPLDRLQPYRLEMGTALATARGRNLYEFWGDAVAERLNALAAAHATPVIVNLASQEYFRAADRPALAPRVVHCVFEEWKPGGWRIVSFHAKRARGLMARYAVRHRVSLPHQLEGFDLEGYAFDAGASAPDRLVFRRR